MLEESSREDWGNSSWMAEVKVFLLTELKAFWRSRDTRTLLWSMSKVFRTPCTTFSAPPGMPTPNWTGAKTPGSSPFMWAMMAELTIL